MLRFNKLQKKLTVSSCAINSSGTNSALNSAGVIQGHFSFTGNKLTITSPFVKPSCTSFITTFFSFCGLGFEIGSRVMTSVIGTLLFGICGAETVAKSFPSFSSFT